MSKFTTLQELAAGLNRCTNSTRYNAWEKGDKKRIYIQGAGYNTKKMATKVWIEVGGDKPFLRVNIECPSQPQSWIDSQEAEILERYDSKIRYCRRFFNFDTSGLPMDVVVNNAVLAAEPVKGYIIQWREVRVAINRFGKLAMRNRQFVVAYQGTKEDAPRTFQPLSDKAFNYLQHTYNGDHMLDAYEPVPDYESRAIAYEGYLADKAERELQAEMEMLERENAKKTQQQEKREQIAQGVASGNDILSAWKAAGCPHPAPAEVVEAKKASGLNWNNFTLSIQ